VDFCWKSPGGRAIEERFFEQKPLDAKPNLAAPAEAGRLGMTSAAVEYGRREDLK
jgi:hypothetical protein